MMKIRLIWLPELIYNLALFSGIYTPILLYLYVIGHFQSFSADTFGLIFKFTHYNTLFSMILALLSFVFYFLNGRYRFLVLAFPGKTNRRMAMLGCIFCFSLVVYIVTKTVDVWTLPTGRYW